MTRVLPLRGAATRTRTDGHPPSDAAVARLTLRLIRRGTVWLAVAIAFYVVLEVYTYEQTYPDLAARQKLATLSDDPAMRMLQGIPHAVDTSGGFVVWDAGWVLAAWSASGRCSWRDVCCAARRRPAARSSSSQHRSVRRGP